MSLATLPLAYLGWHYTLALKDFIILARNGIVFVYRFFSLPTLLKTFFSPWRRLDESYQKGFNPGAWAETFVVNVLMRLVGALIRFWIILAGFIVLFFTIILFVLLFIVWLCLPIIIVTLFILGFNFLRR